MAKNDDIDTDLVAPEIENGPFDHLPPRQRAWCTAYAITGRVTRAASAAGVGPVMHRGSWASEPAFVRARALAEEIHGDLLEDEAARRAREGLRQYKFTSSGEPKRHPDTCECGHDRRQSHVRAVTEPVQEDGKVIDAGGVEMYGPCMELDCHCDRFCGEPYYEPVYSDKLLLALLQGAKPEKYAQRVITSQMLRNIDWDALAASEGGQEAIARLARGEHPYSVFASLASEGAKRFIGPGVELGGPVGSSRADDEEDGGEDGGEDEHDGEL